MKMPYGFKWFIFLSILSVLGSLALLLAFQYLSSIVPSVSAFTPAAVRIPMVISMIASIVGIAAILGRNTILYYLTLLLFVAKILGSLYPGLQMNVAGLLQRLLNISPTLFFLWYFTVFKDYLRNRSTVTSTPHMVSADKKVNVFIIFYVIFFIALSAYSILHSRTEEKKNVSNVLLYTTTLEGKSFRERNEYCLALEDTQQKDSCLLVAFSMTNNKANITPDHCKLFSQESNGVVCYAMIERCDLVAEGQLRDLCMFTSQGLKAQESNGK